MWVDRQLSKCSHDGPYEGQKESSRLQQQTIGSQFADLGADFSAQDCPSRGDAARVRRSSSASFCSVVKLP